MSWFNQLAAMSGVEPDYSDVDVTSQNKSWLDNVLSSLGGTPPSANAMFYVPNVSDNMYGDDAGKMAANMFNPKREIKPFDNSTYTGAFANAFNAGVSGVVGGIADLLHADNIGDMYNRASNAYQDDQAIDAGFNTDYLASPHGLTRDVGNTLGSMAALAPAMALLPESAMPWVARIGGNKVIQGLINAGKSDVAKKIVANVPYGEQIVNALTYGVAKRTAKVAPFAASYAMTAIPEAMSEGGGVRRDAMNKGYDDPDARAWKATAMNLPLLAGSKLMEGFLLGGGALINSPKNALARYISAPFRAAPGAAANAGQNGLEEVYQTAISNSQTGEDYGILPQNWTEEQKKAGMAGLMGSLPLGMASGTAHGVYNNRAAEDAKTDYMNGQPTNYSYAAFTDPLKNGETQSQINTVNNAILNAQNIGEEQAAQPMQPQRTDIGDSYSRAPQQQGIKDDTDSDVSSLPMQDIEDKGLANTNAKLKSRYKKLFNEVKEKTGKELVVSGGARSKENNAANNGSPNSHHLYGDAIDVDYSMLTEDEKAWVLDRAKELGFNQSGDTMHDNHGGNGDHMHLTYEADTKENKESPEPSGGFKSSGNADYDKWINQYAEQYGVPANLLSSLLETESGYNKDAVSEAGAIGIAQFTPSTAEGMGIDPHDPQQSIEGAARYLSDMYGKYHDWHTALEAYNGGEGNIGIAETKAYADKVLNGAGDIAALGKENSNNSNQSAATENNLAAPQLDTDSLNDNAFNDEQLGADFYAALNNDLFNGVAYKADDVNALMAMLDADGEYIDTPENRVKMREMFPDETQKAAEDYLVRHAPKIKTANKAAAKPPQIDTAATKYIEQAKQMLNVAQDNNIPMSVKAINAALGSHDPKAIKSAHTFLTNELKRNGLNTDGTPLNANNKPSVFSTVPSSQPSAKANNAPVDNSRALVPIAMAEPDAKAGTASNMQTARAIAQVAADNNLNLPKGVNAMLKEGQPKAIRAAQQKLTDAGINVKAAENVVAAMKGDNNHEKNTSSTETESTPSTVNAENQIQHAEPRPSETTESQDKQITAPHDSPHIAASTYTDTRNGKELSGAKPKGKIKKEDFAQLKKIAKRHGGYYSTFKQAKRFLFKNNADRDSFIEDAEREVFKSQDYVHNAETKKAAANGSETLKLSDGYKTESGRPLDEANPDEFILQPNGSKDFGKISKEIELKTEGNVKAAPIRLQVGNKDFGYIHLLKHSEQMGQKGYSVMEYLNHALNNFNQIYSQQTNTKPNRFVLYCADESKGFVPIDLMFENGKDNYYTIVSAMPHRAKIKGTLLFDGSANPSTATTDGTLLDNANKKGGVETLPNTHEKNNVPSTPSIAQAEEKGKSAESSEGDYHGYLDDKKPGAIAEIKQALAERIDPFGGARKGLYTVKHLIELYAAKDNPPSHGKRGNRYYIGGVPVKKAASLYYEYLLSKNGKNSEIKNSKQDTGEMPAVIDFDAVDRSTKGDSQRGLNQEDKLPHKDETKPDSIFGDVETAKNEMLAALGIDPDELEDEVLTAPQGIVNTAEERERLKKELSAELNKINSNPMFNPKIYTLGLKLAMTYVADGINTVKKLIARLHSDFGDSILPWAPALAETVRTWEKGVPFDEKKVMSVTKMVGALYESGKIAPAEIKESMQSILKNRYQEFEPMVNASYNGIKLFFDNMEENKNVEQPAKSTGTDERLSRKQSGATIGAADGGRPAEVSRAETKRSGRQGSGNTDRTDTANTEGTRPADLRAGSKLETATGDRASQRGNTPNAAVTETAGHDYEIKETTANKKSPEERYKENINAIRLLKELEYENRLPTPNEQKILAGYNGWGGLKKAFLDEQKNKELRELLTAEEYQSARSTINDAFYTSPAIVRAMWEGVSRLGFKGGRVLDPSMGAGNFFGCMPRGMLKSSSLRGVEIDNLTSRLAKMLYPSAYIENTGFEKSAVADNYYDLVISNIPFGQNSIGKYKIHNYFFANGIDKVRPGGLMVFITSQASLSSNSREAMKMREYLADKADLIAAYKLPEGTFSEAGTGVISDIVIMQKRGTDGTRSPYAQSFAKIGTYKNVLINDYFKDHEENILGQIGVGKNQYGDNALTVKADSNAIDAIGDRLVKAMQKLPPNIYHKDTKEKAKAFDPAAANKQAIADEKTRDLEYYIDSSGKAVQNQNGEAVAVTGKKEKIIKAYIKVKDALNDTIAKQIDPHTSEQDLDHSRQALNKAYDVFVKRYGYLNNAATAKNFVDDPSAGMVQALEKFKLEGTGRTQKLVDVKKAAIFTERTMEVQQEITRADSPSDALLASLANTGGVDLDYMAKLLNAKPEQIIAALKDKIFKNPQTEGYETREEYLSGNVREKLAQAEEAARTDKSYQSNVDELKKVQPQDLVSSEIYAAMGAPWIPASDINDFLKETRAKSGGFGSVEVVFTPGLAKWTVSGRAILSKYAVDGIGFGDLLNNILNNKAIEIYDGKGKDKTLSQEKTDAANAVADRIRDDFSAWLWSDKAREKRLVDYYNANYNNTVLREYDGSHLNLHGHGMNVKINLRPHQKNVVWRMLQKANTLIAHCVGAGKTFEMQAAGMEMRRLGIAKKPLYCLPNNVVEQFAREFRQLYPNAKLLVLQSSDLPSVPSLIKKVKTADGREKLDKSALDKMDDKAKARYYEKRTARNRILARIQTEDWDGIILSHSLFERLPLTPETTAGFINEQIKDMEETLYLAKGDRGVDSRALSGLETRIKTMKERVEKILNTSLEEIGIPFEKLGIDQIFVDEADLFKNLGFSTSLDRISGLTNSDANRSNDMFVKTQWLTRQNGGRGVVFATGTPISNTMAEMFTMLRYLNLNELKAKGLNLFDNWIRTFGEIGTGIERKPDGNGFRKVNKVKRFINMPELIKMFRSVADVKTQDDLNLDIPKLKDGKPTIITLKPDPVVDKYIKETVPKRIAQMKGGMQSKGADNMLSLTNDLRKLSLTDGKINACAERIADKFEKTADIKGAQLVFCDLGIPKAEKDTAKAEDSDQLEKDTDDTEIENVKVYQKLKDRLIDLGIPKKQIAFVQDAKTKAKLDELFRKVDAGEIRILIGSTQKMGAGTNCQHHLVALHDIDAPWRPRDLEQRHGRILRQGNPNKEVEIFNYVVQDSFDANMWEKLKNKAAIISQAMSGNTQLRAVEDADPVTLTYAEAEGAATGNPLIKKQLDLQGEVTKLANAVTAFKRQQRAAEEKLNTLPETIAADKAIAEKIQTDIDERTDTAADNFKMTVGQETYTDRQNAEAALKKILDVFSKETSTEIGDIGGMKLKALKTKDHGLLLQLVKNRAYDVETNTVRGIENALRSKPEAMLRKKKEEISVNETALTAAKNTLKQENPYEDKLKTAKTELDKINRQIESELVDSGNKPKTDPQTTNYSLTEGTPIADLKAARKTIDERIDGEIKAVLPMAKNIKPIANSDGTLAYSFKMPNGADVSIKIGDTLSIRQGDENRARSEHGIAKDVAITVNGVTYTSGNKAIIALARNGKAGTVYHELFHVAYSMALLESEKDALKKAYGDQAKALGMSLEEYSADRFRDWVTAKQAGKHVNYGKLWSKINDMAQKLADLVKKLMNIAKTPEVNELFSNIENGKIWQRSIDKNVREYDNKTKIAHTEITSRLKELVDKGRITDKLDWLEIRELLMSPENHAVQVLLRQYKSAKKYDKVNADELYNKLKGAVKYGERKRFILSEPRYISEYARLLRSKNMGGAESYFAKMVSRYNERGLGGVEKGLLRPDRRDIRLEISNEYAPSWKDPIVDNIRNEFYDEYNQIEQARERSDRDALSSAENEGDNRLRYDTERNFTDSADNLGDEEYNEGDLKRFADLMEDERVLNRIRDDMSLEDIRELFLVKEKQQKNRLVAQYERLVRINDVPLRIDITRRALKDAITILNRMRRNFYDKGNIEHLQKTLTDQNKIGRGSSLAQSFSSVRNGVERRGYKDTDGQRLAATIAKSYENQHTIEKEIQQELVNENSDSTLSRSDRDGFSYSLSPAEERRAPEHQFLNLCAKALGKKLGLKSDKIIVEEEKNEKGITFLDWALKSPSRIAEKVAAFRTYYRMADNATKAITKNRTWFDNHLAKAYAKCQTKEDKDDLFKILLDGDSEQKEWTRDELIADGVKAGVADAYIAIRRLMNKAYGMVNEARRRPKFHTINGISDHKLKELKDNKFVEIMQTRDLADGSQAVTYKEYANHEAEYKNIDADTLDQYRNSNAMQILLERQNADGTYNVKVREGITDLNKLTGYIPHFFHQYMIRVMDKQGKVIATIGSGRTENEAVARADEWLKDNKLGADNTIHIAPKAFDFTQLGMDETKTGAVMGDKDFYSVMNSLAKNNGMTLDEAREMLKGSVKLKNRHRFFGNALHRKGVAGYEKDLNYVLNHYFHSAVRYHALETMFKPQAINRYERQFGDFNKVPPSITADYIRDYINDINGNPTVIEKLLNDTLNRSKWYRRYVTANFGERSALRATSTLTNATSYLCLGYLNTSSALLNLTQVMNAAAYIGNVNALAKCIAKGMHRKYKMSDLKILVETGVLDDVGLDSGAGYDINRMSAKDLLGKLNRSGMILFKVTEGAVRRGTVLAAYEAGRKRGMTHKQAIDFAIDVNRKSNFDYSVADAPNIFRRGSVISQIALQFKKYGIKELEVMADMFPTNSKTNFKQKAIFWACFFLTAGLMGLPFSDLPDDLLFDRKMKLAITEEIMSMTGDSEIGKAIGKTILYGLGASTLGIDISSRAGLSDVVPTSGRDLMGASISKPVSFISDFFKGDKAAMIRDFSPGIYNQYAAWIAGESTGKRGRVNNTYDTFYDKLLRAIGFKSTEERVDSDIARIVTMRKTNRSEERQKAIDDYIADSSTENFLKLKKLGITAKQVKEERAKKKMDKLERAKAIRSKPNRRKNIDSDLYSFAE